MTGIYKIENKINGKVYIGQALDINKRFREHKSALLNKRHYNILLQRSFNKYGIDSFVFEAIEECDGSILADREEYWTNQYGGIDSINRVCDF